MDYDSILQEQMDKLDLSELEQIMDDAAKQSNGIFSSISTDDIVQSFIDGKPLFDSEVIMHNLLDVFLYEIKAGLILGVEIISICIVMGLLKNFSNSFGDKPVSTLGTVVCSCLVITLCLKNFMTTYDACLDTLNIMTRTMQILLPIMIPLLIAMGGFSSGGVLNPVIVGAITAFNTALQKFILPILFVSSIFILINSLTEKDYVSRLAVFLRKAAVFFTGLAVTIFAGLTAIQGLVTKTADGLLANTARYSVDNFVPIVGGFAADSIDMVLSCVAVIKNGIGVLGIIIILCLLTVPVIKILAIAVIYKITSILVGPIGSKQIAGSLDEMGSAVITMAVILFLCALMFLIFLTIIIGIGGGTLWK
ncbi:stage III sporulation protein AE [Anaerovorax odorimutans]|uniref:Stage III sporulation protein AE n=1 Tax=Anaerovorax odorimutans TaxID=109327 RepID=A0ABT1RL21_9FIRM|nr:stage III sporulation protein AE [Anaerovorax odorimutans]MCQ4635890.1 stage III sporulation protein AE [Anaerovorax odorimutans]